MTLHEKLERMEQVILRARAHFDVWWVDAGTPTRPRLLHTMNDFSEFFRFDEHAHQFAFVCQSLPAPRSSPQDHQPEDPDC